ncbi:MAG: hypothetical protein GXX96_10500 [Planctomycetaceae bacterium]|nr:hypothetical protein [Planctomycetaceae bacterium]
MAYRRSNCRLGLALMGCFLLAVGQSRADPLRAGAAATDIGPIANDQPVHDPPQLKALVVDNGQTRLAIVCLDAIGVSTQLTAAIRNQIKQQVGIEPQCVLVNASHNHHGGPLPPPETVAARAAETVKRAGDGLVPVRASAGTGHEERITMNRRLQLADGKAWTIRRAMPSPPDDEIRGVGTVDSEIGVLRLDRTDGRPLAVLYNFAVHAYGGVPSAAVTADLPGFASRVVEEGLGDGSVALFLQGCAGDITPVLYKDVDAPPPTERLGAMLGLSTLSALRKLEPTNDVTVRAVSRSIKLPRRTDLETRIHSLESQQEQILQFFSGTGCGAHGAGTFLNFKTFLPLYMKHLADPEHPSYSSYRYLQEEQTTPGDLDRLDADNRQRIEKYLAAIEQMEKLIRVRGNLAALEALQKEGTEPIDAEIQGLRIGPFVLVTFPGEPFAEVGLNIKRRSPAPETFVAGYSNGHFGYAPTADAYSEEAYEDVNARFGPEWQALFETEALKIIEELIAPAQ